MRAMLQYDTVARRCAFSTPDPFPFYIEQGLNIYMAWKISPYQFYQKPEKSGDF
jgi:hypothetical protein